ncbi:hypothetical protein R6Q59_025153 [Mikania micrantha]
MLLQLERVIMIKWVIDLVFIPRTMMETRECGRSNDPRGIEFYDFLHEEVCLNFKRMKKTESMVKKHNGVNDGRTESSETAINCGDHEYQIFDKNDLLRFGEHDIKILAMHQIKTDPVFEVHGKDFTSLVASIVRTKLWAGSKVMQTLPTEP